MYNYEWDKESGGYILNTLVKFVEKELRPVFFEELDLLGFDDYYNYDECEDPIMWAEARRYVYRGEYIAEARGGSLYTKPQLMLTEKGEELKGQSLENVNIGLMIERNKSIMDNLVSSTCETIYNYYKKYENKVDAFYVAFSGGKDSSVLLELVYSVLPENSFYVVFGDTKMETSDTYEAIEKTKNRYTKITKFETATTKFDAIQSWQEFGPPSRVMRWCCSVHKSTPSILKMKEILNKPNAKIMGFNGVRAAESFQRSSYEMLSDGVKHDSQINCSPILEWTSAELFLFLFDKRLLINNSYRKGLSRVGCILCPMASNFYEYLANYYYGAELKPYLDIIKNLSSKSFTSDAEANKYIEYGGWKARKNGVDLSIANETFSIVEKNEAIVIQVEDLSNDWYQWIKILKHRKESKNRIIFFYEDQQYTCCIDIKGQFTIFTIKSFNSKISATFMKLFKATINKSVYCKKCRVCEIDCKLGAISVVETISVDESKCVHCYKCLSRDNGCIVANSLRIGGKKNMSIKGMCGYNHFGLRNEWIDLTVAYGDDFWNKIKMGKPMVDSCKKWFREAEIFVGGYFTRLHSLLAKEGSESKYFWEIVYINLVNNSPLFKWFTNNMELQTTFSNEEIYELMGETLSSSSKASALLSLKNTLESTNFSKAYGCAVLQTKGKNITSIQRKSWDSPNSLAILYAMYKFAEKTDGGWYSFSFTNLINDSEDREAISPMKIFGMNEVELKQVLQGLDVDYPEFISVAFKKGLENIDLKKGKTSKDILELILSEVK